jgi:hypothetical protein
MSAVEQPAYSLLTRRRPLLLLCLTLLPLACSSGVEDAPDHRDAVTAVEMLWTGDWEEHGVDGDAADLGQGEDDAVVSPGDAADDAPAPHDTETDPPDGDIGDAAQGDSSAPVDGADGDEPDVTQDVDGDAQDVEADGVDATQDDGGPLCTTESCDDEDPCTKDTCFPTNGCLHEPLSNLDCDDGNACTIGDRCVTGVCFGGAQKDCDDGNACTQDFCTGDGVCDHLNLTGVECNDGDPCTGGDACVSGLCFSGDVNLCPYCGDQDCEPPLEDCNTCVDDCGACDESACGDGVDEDFDALTDCDDPDCVGVEPCVELSCDNDVDDDDDGATDCDDADCAATGACFEIQCGNNLDDDDDGLTDCADPDCQGLGDCPASVCTAQEDLACDTEISGVPVTDEMDEYPACGPFFEMGPERTYRLLIPAGVGQVTATVTPKFADLDMDLYVLDAVCNPSACREAAASTSDFEVLTWLVDPGDLYYVIVEAPSASASFDLQIVCQ